MSFFWFLNCFEMRVTGYELVPILTGRYWLVKIGDFEYVEGVKTVFRNIFTASFCE